MRERKESKVVSRHLFIKDEIPVGFGRTLELEESQTIGRKTVLLVQTLDVIAGNSAEIRQPIDEELYERLEDPEDPLSIDTLANDGQLRADLPPGLMKKIVDWPKDRSKKN